MGITSIYLPGLLLELFPDNLLAVFALTAATAEVKDLFVSLLIEIVAVVLAFEVSLTSVFALFLMLLLVLLMFCDELVAAALLFDVFAANEF